MPLFRRRAPAFAVPMGTLPCTAEGCGNHTAVVCQYRDRRGRQCSAAFCAQHLAIVGDAWYCRRHGSTMTALGIRSHDAGSRPDLEIRGPSLVTHVANHLDDWVREQLANVRRRGETVSTERDVQIIHDPNRRVRWERSWKLFDHTGVIVRVTIFVDDADDSMVWMRVGAEAVGRGVPPWIERRRRGEVADAEADQNQRDLFYAFMRERIAEAIPRVRAQEERYES